MCELVIKTAIKNGDLMSNIENDNLLENLYEKYLDLGYNKELALKLAIEEFYNLEQYPEENPTMIGAFCEILDEIKNNR